MLVGLPRTVTQIKTSQMMTARQSQQGAFLAQQPKDQQLLASLHQQQGFPSPALLGHPENLVTMQRRARMQAAQQFAAANDAASFNEMREALFSRVGRGLVDSVPVPPVMQPGEALNPQMLQLLLLRERLGQQPGNL